MKKWYVWILFISGMGISAFALSVLVTDSSERKLELTLVLVFGVALIPMAIRRNRRPMLWVGTEEIAFPRKGVLRWEAVAGVVVESFLTHSVLFLVPTDPLLRAKLGRFKELKRRFNCWSLGHPVWHGFSLATMQMADLDYLHEILMSKKIPRLEATSWWRRLFGF